MKVRLLRAVTLAVALAVVVAGTSYALTLGTPPPKKPSAALDSQAAGKNITFILPTLSNSVYLSEQAGAVQAQKDYPKVNFSIVAGKNFTTSDDVIALIQAAIVKHANVIVVNTSNPTSELFPVLEQAIAAGIKVISYDANIDVPGNSGFVGTDEEAAAFNAGQWLRQALPHGGPIGFIMCVPGHPVTEAKKRGFFAAIRGSNLHVVSNLDADCDPVKGRAVMQDMITAHPTIKAVMSISDAQTVGVVQALKALKKHIIVASLDASDAILPLIQSGWVGESAPEYSYQMGYLAATSAVWASVGNTLPSLQYSSGPYSVVDKSNVNKFIKQKQYH
jgi:ribose transport system substrate-binding protein